MLEYILAIAVYIQATILLNAAFLPRLLELTSMRVTDESQMLKPYTMLRYNF